VCLGQLFYFFLVSFIEYMVGEKGGWRGGGDSSVGKGKAMMVVVVVVQFTARHGWKKRKTHEDDSYNLSEQLLCPTIIIIIINKLRKINFLIENKLSCIIETNFSYSVSWEIFDLFKKGR